MPPSVPITSTKLVRVGRKIERTEVAAVTTFSNQDFRDILSNQGGSVVACLIYLAHTFYLDCFDVRTLQESYMVRRKPRDLHHLRPPEPRDHSRSQVIHVGSL